LWCKKTVWRFLDKKDGKSTSNLQKHAKSCWGEDAVSTADNAKNANEACKGVVKSLLMMSSITATFEKSGKGKVTFLHRQHTKTEAKYVQGHINLYIKLKLCSNRAEIVHWVSENL
jgi:dihydroorotase